MAGLSPTDSKQGAGNASKFSHMSLESILVEVKSKNQIHLSAVCHFCQTDLFFSLDEQFAFLFFAPIGIGHPELLSTEEVFSSVLHHLFHLEGVFPIYACQESVSRSQKVLFEKVKSLENTV